MWTAHIGCEILIFHTKHIPHERIYHTKQCLASNKTLTMSNIKKWADKQEEKAKAASELQQQIEGRIDATGESARLE